MCGAVSGLRSIRYAAELQDVLEVVVAGDLDPEAVRCIERNREKNDVPAALLQSKFLFINRRVR